MPMTQLFDELLAEVQEFASGRVFEDDVCLVGMEAADDELRIKNGE